MPNGGSPSQSADMHFTPLKVTSVDERGRFYLPESVCRTLFAQVHPKARQVGIYLGAGTAAGMILLVPSIPGHTEPPTSSGGEP